MAPRTEVLLNSSNPNNFQGNKDPITGGELKSISWEELARHNTSRSCWIAVRGKVYDVTKFLRRHPGGIDTLLYGAGRDATIVVETYHDLDSLTALLDTKFLIGYLGSDELPTFPSPNPFHRQLKDKVKAHFKGGKDPKNPGLWVVLRYLGIYGIVLGSWLATHSGVGMWSQIMLSLLLGFGCALIGLHPLHDASHFAITHSPTVWKWLGATHDFLNGTSYLVWVYQHMLGHHPYTNIPGADPDIATNDPDVRRIQPFQTWYSRYLNQELYVPFLYGALAWKTRIQDILILYVYQSNDGIRINPPTLYHNMVFWLGKGFFVFYRIILPVYLLGARQAIANLIISDLVSSYWLALTFQVNHVVDNVEFIPLPPSNAQSKEIEMDWAEMQLRTTQDYAHEDTAWTWATGGLNYQAVHHVFPNVHQAHYPALAPLIEKISKEFNVPFICQDSFMDAFWGHINHLKVMGSVPGSAKK